MTPNSTILSLATVVALSSASFADDAFPPMPPVKAHTPVETIASIQLPPGYHLELVLSARDRLYLTGLSQGGFGVFGRHFGLLTLGRLWYHARHAAATALDIAFDIVLQ